MPDREKVVKGLEALQKSMSEHQCYTCSYEFIETVKEFGTNIIADAITLLKEQEEKIKNRDESLEKAREEIKWLRGMLKEQEEPKQIVRCENCNRRGTYDCPIYVGGDGDHGSPDDWFCADGTPRKVGEVNDK